MGVIIIIAVCALVLLVAVAFVLAKKAKGGGVAANKDLDKPAPLKKEGTSTKIEETKMVWVDPTPGAESVV